MIPTAGYVESSSVQKTDEGELSLGLSRGPVAGFADPFDDPRTPEAFSLVVGVVVAMVPEGKHPPRSGGPGHRRGARHRWHRYVKKRISFFREAKNTGGCLLFTRVRKWLYGHAQVIDTLNSRLERLPELRRFYNSSALLQGGKQKMTVAERKAESRKAIETARRCPALRPSSGKTRSPTRVTTESSRAACGTRRRAPTAGRSRRGSARGPRSCRPSSSGVHPVSGSGGY